MNPAFAFVIGDPEAVPPSPRSATETFSVETTRRGLPVSPLRPILTELRDRVS